MIVAENLAAGPGVGYCVRVSLTKCWADDSVTRRAIEEGRHGTTAIPCGNPVDEDSVGLCASCLGDIVG